MLRVPAIFLEWLSRPKVQSCHKSDYNAMAVGSLKCLTGLNDPGTVRVPIMGSLTLSGCHSGPLTLVDS